MQYYSFNSLYEQENLRWKEKKYSWNEEVYSRLSPRQKCRVNLMRAYGDLFLKLSIYSGKTKWKKLWKYLRSFRRYTGRELTVMLL